MQERVSAPLQQVPLAGQYIVDFCAPRARLVNEVDGECHAERRCADARRDAALRALGYRVLRILAVSRSPLFCQSPCSAFGLRAERRRPSLRPLV